MRGSMVVAVTAAVLAACGVAGCGGSSSSASSEAGGGGGAAKQPIVPAAPSGAVAGAPQHSSATSSPFNQDAALGPKHSVPKQRSTVIKTGRLSIKLSSDGTGKAWDEANRVAARYGGFIMSSDLSSSKHETSTIVIRVPAASFTDAIGRLQSAGLGKLKSVQVTGEDVGKQFVDLNARARNLRAQEKALIRLMNKAVTVSDTIKIQNELFQIQGQIEQLQGQLNYLHDQADMSTITMLLTSPGAVHHPGQPTAIGSALRRSWQRATDVVTAVIVGAGVVIPLAILALIGLIAGRLLWPPLRRRMAEQPAAPTTTAE
jgi:uncharacterized protein DUF4349